MKTKEEVYSELAEKIIELKTKLTLNPSSVAIRHKLTQLTKIKNLITTNGISIGRAEYTISKILDEE